VRSRVLALQLNPGQTRTSKGEPVIGDEEEFGELVIPPDYPFAEPDSSRTL
jgi:hypothetical protein